MREHWSLKRRLTANFIKDWSLQRLGLVCMTFSTCHVHQNFVIDQSRGIVGRPCAHGNTGLILACVMLRSHSQSLPLTSSLVIDLFTLSCRSVFVIWEHFKYCVRADLYYIHYPESLNHCLQAKSQITACDSEVFFFLFSGMHSVLLNDMQILSWVWSAALLLSKLWLENKASCDGCLETGTLCGWDEQVLWSPDE